MDTKQQWNETKEDLRDRFSPEYDDAVTDTLLDIATGLTLFGFRVGNLRWGNPMGVKLAGPIPHPGEEYDRNERKRKCRETLLENLRMRREIYAFIVEFYHTRSDDGLPPLMAFISTEIADVLKGFVICTSNAPVFERPEEQAAEATARAEKEKAYIELEKFAVFLRERWRTHAAE